MRCETCDAPLIDGNELVVALTSDEVSELLAELRERHTEDFEPECPVCTAAVKLQAAYKAHVAGVAVAGETVDGGSNS